MSQSTFVSNAFKDLGSSDEEKDEVKENRVKASVSR
jgi:hypothetical protein